MTKTDMNKMMAQFTRWLVASANEDVYYQLKNWLCQCDIEDDEYGDILDYMAYNLNGRLQWVED